MHGYYISCTVGALTTLPTINNFYPGDMLEQMWWLYHDRVLRRNGRPFCQKGEMNVPSLQPMTNAAAREL
jgi:hypothetical protein